jgi:hypothetical protein
MGKLNKNQIKHLKEQYGGVYEIEIDGKKGWFRKPDKLEFFMFLDMSEQDELKATETVMETLWLEGDREILDDDEYFIGASAQIEKLFVTLPTKVEKKDNKQIVTVTKNNKVYKAMFNKITRGIFFEITGMMSQGGQLSTAMEKLFYALVSETETDKPVYEDTDIFISVLLRLTDLINIKQSTLKKN